MFMDLESFANCSSVSRLTDLNKIMILILAPSVRRVKRFLDRKKGSLVPGAEWTVLRSKFDCSEGRRSIHFV